MKKSIDEIDEEDEKKQKAHSEEMAKTGPFMKLYPFNTPRFLIFLGCAGSGLLGGSIAYLGVVFS